MTKCIAFHSYKGGTGKSTRSFNLSAQMVKRGLKVLLLDLDVYAPSLQTYLDVRPDHWINDFLFEDAKLNDVVTDLTHVVNKYDQEKPKIQRRANYLWDFPTDLRTKFTDLKDLSDRILLWFTFLESLFLYVKRYLQFTILITLSWIQAREFVTGQLTH